jgi:hypothetical protein
MPIKFTDLFLAVVGVNEKGMQGHAVFRQSIYLWQPDLYGIETKDISHNLIEAFLLPGQHIATWG